jgi:ElaB/YqjD/DUF883 family membrane-anchored ribosome-binding protein
MPGIDEYALALQAATHELQAAIAERNQAHDAVRTAEDKLQRARAQYSQARSALMDAAGGFVQGEPW